MPTPHEALDALAQETGTPLSFNEQGLCRLRFDGKYIVDLEVADDARSIFLYSRLAPLPEGARGAELAARLLRAHCLERETGGVMFGLDGMDVLAFRRVALAEAEPHVLYTRLEQFLDVLERWSPELA